MTETTSVLRDSAMGQVCHSWWRLCREIHVFSRFECHMLPVLYPFVACLLTLSRICVMACGKVLSGEQDLGCAQTDLVALQNLSTTSI
jgi:hypothetical protein